MLIKITSLKKDFNASRTFQAIDVFKDSEIKKLATAKLKKDWPQFRDAMDGHYKLDVSYDR